MSAHADDLSFSRLWFGSGPCAPLLLVAHTCCLLPPAVSPRLLCRYGRDDVAKLLTALCPVDISKSEKLQDVEWVGKVLNAARTGDAAAMKELLTHKRAKQRLGKLRKALPEVREGAGL